MPRRKVLKALPDAFLRRVMAQHKFLLLIALLLLAGAGWIVYGRALDTPFVFDDSVTVTDNRSITRLWPLVGDAEHAGPLNPAYDTTTSGRPLVNLSLALNYQFGQLDPLGYHVFNLIVHVLSAFVLMAIVHRTLLLDFFRGQFQRTSRPLAFAAALLWLVHPLQTEPVLYVTQRTELMVGFFYLATLYASLRYWAAASTAGRNTWLALATLACVAGVACKEVMVTAPVIVLLFERTFISSSFRRALRTSWPLYVGLFFSWIVLLLLNHAGPRSRSAGFNVGIPAYVWWFTQTQVLLMYLKLAIWPSPLSIHYGMPYLTTLGAAWPWLVVVAVLASATLVLVWRRSAIGFVGACVLIILSPTLVVPIVTEVAAERRMHLPLAALIALLVVGGYWLVQRSVARLASANASGEETNKRASIITAIVGCLLAVVWSIVSIHDSAAFHDELALWQNALLSQPDDFFVRYNLGNELARAGQLQAALAQYQESLRINPSYPDAHNNLGNTLLDTGLITAAIQQFEQTLWLDPNHAGAHNGLGKTYARLGKFPEAIAQYQEAIRLKPDFAEAHNNLGNALVRTNHPKDALEQYEIALQLKPTFSNAHANLAAALASLGKYAEAIAHYQEAIRLQPDNFDALANMALTYAARQQPADAIKAAEDAIALAHSHGDAELAGQIETWLINYRATAQTQSSKSTASP